MSDEKVSLYKIIEGIDLIFSKIEQRDGEITDLDEALLEDLHLLLEKKTDGVADFRRMTSDKMRNCKNRIVSLQERYKRHERALDRFDSYIKSCLIKSGKDSFEGSLNTIKLGRKSKSVEIQEGFETFEGNERFMMYKTTAKPDKGLIKEAFKIGKEVKGAKLVENQQLSFK